MTALRLSRRGLLAGALSTTATMALSACGAGWGFDPASSDGKIHLTYALWDMRQAEGYRKSLDVFEKLHPNIKVTIRQIPYGSYQPKITSEFISDSAPDLFWVNTPALGTWAENGVLMDIAPYVRRDKVDLKQYHQPLVGLHAHGKSLYGLPKDWDTIAFFYNKDYFAEHGLTPRSDLTWAPDGSGTFLPFLKKATTDTAGRSADSPGFDPENIKTYATTMPNDFQSSWGNFLAMNGGSVLPRPYARTTTLDTSEAREALTFMTSTLPDAHVTVPSSETGPNGNADNIVQLFVQGRIAMVPTGSWQVSGFRDSVDFPLGVMSLPTGPKGRISVMNGLIDGINAHTPHPEEAWQVAKWLGSEQSQEIMAEDGYVFPGITKLNPLFLEYWKTQGVDMQPFLDAAQGEVANFPVAPGIGQALTDIAPALGPLFYGTMPADRALKEAQTVADHDLAVS